MTDPEIYAFIIGGISGYALFLVMFVAASVRCGKSSTSQYYKDELQKRTQQLLSARNERDMLRQTIDEYILEAGTLKKQAE